MPELPDLIAYVEGLDRRILGRTLEGVRLANAFVLRSVDPPIGAVSGKRVLGLSLLGKRIVLDLEDELHIIVHLMIAGRLHWCKALVPLQRRQGHAAFDFENGSLVLTEAGTKKRASITLVRGRAALARHDPGGIDVLTADFAAFAGALRRENHTLKRALTDPRLFGGIGNAYSDEILHRARLSPLSMTMRLADDDIVRLFKATQETLGEWILRLRTEAGDGFPEKVTAFREEMAVHGRYRLPCPVCGTQVQRIVRGNHETNYCPRCQTGGRIFADRALSRLLKDDWPRTLEELEERLPQGGGAEARSLPRRVSS
ncbi:MAG: formamidopyrimidine-DNA glycosylase [Rhodospirillaceae bacterium]|nr:formamidopyrimidine-DNA glycosylase [Rhodospirillaceae bacterium]